MGHDNWEPIATQARPPLSTVGTHFPLVIAFWEALRGSFGACP